jgi:hypothetical protein
MMLTFDAADRQTCTVRRQRTATPLQALVTMNDPQFIEAARVMAEQALTSRKVPEERITQLFLASVSRSPRAAELEAMKELLHMQMKHFENSPKDALKLSSVGEWPTNKNLNPLELAAYTIVATALLNYDEALVKR